MQELKKETKKKSGFMMIEAVLSIFIVGIALVAFLNVLNMMYQTEFNKRDYVIASNLAQEGIELIRNIRDNNWKNKKAAFGDPFPSAGNACIDYLGVKDSQSDCSGKLYRNNDNFYGYNNGGQITKFFRHIVISESGDTRKIVATVFWRPSGAKVDESIFISDMLYSWTDPQ